MLKSSAIAFTLALSLTCAAPSQAAPADDATAIFQQFLSAFTNADLEGVLGLFSQDALFWGTGSPTLVTDPAGIRLYFARLDTQAPGQTIASALEYSTRELASDLVLVSGMWEIRQAGEATGTTLRVSMALALRDGQWQIIQFHNSRVPE